MKSEWRRYAPVALYIGLAALLITAGLYVIFREFNTYLQVSLAITILGLAVYVLLDPQRVREFLTGRQARYGSNALLMSIAFIGILVVINYMVYQNSKRWDLTEDKANSLTEETLQTLERLPEKVTALAFYSPNRSSETARSLLDTYKYYSNGKFDYQFIDPLSDPVTAQQAGVTRDGTIVFQMGDRQEQVTIAIEREVTSALVRLMSEEGKKVYFLTGHGELGISNESDTENYATAAGILRKKNYEVDTLNLFTTHQVPEDADVIVIAGPLQPLSEDEVSLLEQYLATGGSLIVMEEPIPVTEFGDAADPLADYLTSDWGISLGKDIVVDMTSSQPFVTYADQYGSHLITQKLQSIATAFPTARSVQVTEKEGVASLELIKTASQSWAETDFAALEQQQIQPDEGIDILGPVSIAAVAERQDSSAKVAVFGDANFAAGQNFDFLGNGDLFINTVDWASGQEELIDLTVKTPTTRILLPPEQYVMNLILLGLVFVLPGIVLISGVVVWIQRRRRG